MSLVLVSIAVAVTTTINNCFSKIIFLLRGKPHVTFLCSYETWITNRSATPKRCFFWVCCSYSCLQWVKQCHKPSMAGNGSHIAPIKMVFWLGDGLWHCFTHMIPQRCIKQQSKNESYWTYWTMSHAMPLLGVLLPGGCIPGAFNRHLIPLLYIYVCVYIYKYIHMA